MKSRLLTTCLVASTVLGCAAEPVDSLDADATSAANESALTFYGWEGWDALGGIAVGEPAVAATTATRTDVFVVGGNYRIYHRWQDGGEWQPAGDGNWEDLGNTGGTGLENVVAVAHPQVVEIFARERSTGHLVTRYMTRLGSFGPWQNLDGVFVGRPAVASVPVDSDGGALGTIHTYGTHVVVRAPDNTIWARWGVASMYQGWYQLPGATSDNPAIWSKDKHVELIVRGTNNNLYREWRDDGTNWQPQWQPLSSDGQAIGVPAVTGSSATDVFVASDWADKGMRVNHLAGSSWTGFQGIPGAVPWSDRVRGPARPMVTSGGEGGVSVYVQGTDFGLYQMHSWLSWGGLKLAPCFQTAAAPAIAARSNINKELVIVAKNGSVWHRHHGSHPSSTGPQPPECSCGGDDSECCYNDGCNDGRCDREGDTLVCRCGDANQACCGGNSCSSGLACEGSTNECQQCGEYLQIPCPGNVCRGTDIIGVPDGHGGMQCQHCGGPSQYACPGNVCHDSFEMPVPQGNGYNKCTQCGYFEGDVCCAGSTCPNDWDHKGLTCQRGIGPLPEVGQCRVPATTPPPPPPPPPPPTCSVPARAHATTCYNLDGTVSSISHSFCADGCGSSWDAAKQNATISLSTQSCLGPYAGCCQFEVDQDFNDCGK